ncbi:hypothetical protein QTP70_025006, partial [Hemibagrus guttatus]
IEMDKVSKLEDRVKELEELMCETQRECERETKDLQVTLAEAEKKYEKEMKCHAQLENENSDLISNMNLLQDTVQEHKKELHDVHRKCNMIMKEYEQKEEEHNMLKSEYTKAKESLEEYQYQIECFKEVLAKTEKKCEKMKEVNDELQQENSYMVSDIAILHDKVKNEKQDLIEACRLYNMVQMEYNQVQEDCNVLLTEYLVLTNTIAQNEASLTNLHAVLAETERKCEQMTESSSVLEHYNSCLISDLDSLHDWVNKLKNNLFMIECQQNKIISDNQKAQGDYDILKSKYEETVQKYKKLLQEFDHEQERHDILKAQCNKMKEAFPINEKSLKEMESNVERASELMSEVTTLQASIQQLEEELHDARRKFDEITAKREKEQKVHNVQQLQNQEMAKTFKKFHMLVKRHCRDSSEDRRDP